MARGESLADAVRDGARAGAGLDEMADSLTRVRALSRGLGPVLAPVLADPSITDVLVNGSQAWIDRGGGLERADLDLGTDDDVRSLAIHMAAACGDRLDEASPIVDATLPGGIRLHAVLPPLSAAGPLISLRTSRSGGLSLADMEADGTCAPLIGRVLRALVDRRANVLVSGATGSGKTTLLASLLSLVPPDERIVCIEEVTELRPVHPHVVNLRERRANVQGAGAVTLADLVRAAMRMRPDRLVLGECRGPEVREVLTALNTGHDGGATIHANGADEVPARLQALGALAGLGEAAVSAQAVAAFDAVVHMRRRPRRAGDQGPGRWVAEVGVLVREGAGLGCELAVRVSPEGDVRRGPGWERLARRLGLDAGGIGGAGAGGDIPGGASTGGGIDEADVGGAASRLGEAGAGRPPGVSCAFGSEARVVPGDGTNHAALAPGGEGPGRAGHPVVGEAVLVFEREGLGRAGRPVGRLWLPIGDPPLRRGEAS
nr:TadA family conjugal transfer-associated ATPase [Actinomyces sp. B33]